MIGVVTYLIVDGFDSPPTDVTCNGYVPIVDKGTVATIVVSVNNVIANGDDPIVKDKGFWAVL